VGNRAVIDDWDIKMDAQKKQLNDELAGTRKAQVPVERVMPLSYNGSTDFDECLSQFESVAGLYR